MHPPLAATSRDSKQLQSPSLTSPVGRTPPVQAGQRPASRCTAIPTSVCRVSTADGQGTGARGAQMPQRRGDSAPAAAHRRPGQRHAPCRQSMAGAWLSSHSLRRCVRDSASSAVFSPPAVDAVRVARAVDALRCRRAIADGRTACGRSRQLSLDACAHAPAHRPSKPPAKLTMRQWAHRAQRDVQWAKSTVANMATRSTFRQEQTPRWRAEKRREQKVALNRPDAPT
jgi:hypothetical protein